MEPTISHSRYLWYNNLKCYYNWKRHWWKSCVKSIDQHFLTLLTVVISTNCWDYSFNLCHVKSSDCHPALLPPSGRFQSQYTISCFFFYVYDMLLNYILMLINFSLPIFWFHCWSTGASKFIISFIWWRCWASNPAASATYNKCSLESARSSSY
jgi:hypothetical protein